jgi:hypothetical protein
MQTKKSINPEIVAAVLEYKKAIENSKKNPDNKVLKIQVSHLKYIVKSGILKEYIKNG